MVIKLSHQNSFNRISRYTGDVPNKRGGSWIKLGYVSFREESGGVTYFDVDRYMIAERDDMKPIDMLFAIYVKPEIPRLRKEALGEFLDKID